MKISSNYFDSRKLFHVLPSTLLLPRERLSSVLNSPEREKKTRSSVLKDGERKSMKKLWKEGNQIITKLRKRKEEINKEYCNRES